MVAEAVQIRGLAIRDYTRAQVTYMVCAMRLGFLHCKATNARLDGLNFKVEGNQGKYEALRDGAQRGEEARSGGGKKTCLEVLYEIIENAKTFRIFAVLDVDQRTDLCRLCEYDDSQSAL